MVREHSTTISANTEVTKNGSPALVSYLSLCQCLSVVTFSSNVGGSELCSLSPRKD